MPTHFDPAEFDALVTELRRRPGVENPDALASYILGRREANPGRTWRADRRFPRRFRTEEAGATFTLYAGVPDPQWPMDNDDGWTWWWLEQDGDTVSVCHIMGDLPDPAVQLADEWIALWAARVGVRD